MSLMLINTALLCMAMNIYKEARSEPIPGQYAVAFVTMQRAEQNPNKVCDVVSDRKQFSWVNKLKVERKNKKVVIYAKKPKDLTSWDRAKKIAKIVLMNRISNFVGPVTHYHSVYVHPKWRYSLKPVRVIGTHIFYREDKSLMRKA